MGKYAGQFGDEPYDFDRFYYLIAECAVLAMDALRMVQATGSPGEEALAWEADSAGGWTADSPETITHRGATQRPRMRVLPNECRVQHGDIVLTGRIALTGRDRGGTGGGGTGRGGTGDGTEHFGFESMGAVTRDMDIELEVIKYTILESFFFPRSVWSYVE